MHGIHLVCHMEHVTGHIESWRSCDSARAASSPRTAWSIGCLPIARSHKCQPCEHVRRHRLEDVLGNNGRLIAPPLFASRAYPGIPFWGCRLKSVVQITSQAIYAHTFFTYLILLLALSACQRWRGISSLRHILAHSTNRVVMRSKQHCTPFVERTLRISISRPFPSQAGVKRI
jgi:hypothetical protein